MVRTALRHLGLGFVYGVVAILLADLLGMEITWRLVVFIIAMSWVGEKLSLLDAVIERTRSCEKRNRKP